MHSIFWRWFVVLDILELSPDTDYYCSGAKKISVVVIDGVTIGHPCCAIHNCHVPLSNNRHRYCDNHIDNQNIYGIVGCSEKVAPNKRTCLIAEHQTIEKVHSERTIPATRTPQTGTRCSSKRFNRWICQWRLWTCRCRQWRGVWARFFHSQASHTSSDPTVKRKNRRRVQFGRKRTHNEQVIVTPCGMIIACETFFGAEAVSSMVVWFFLSSLGLYTDTSTSGNG